ncbi:MAG: hypothetical protein ACR2Q3_16170 [Woeseiaceae bacterium]
MDTKHPPRYLPVAAQSLLTAIVIASLGWSASTLAATTNKADCNTYSNRAEPLENPLAALSFNAVDHVTVEAESSAIDELENDQAASERAAPFLYLTPRVASVLRDIFDLADESLSEPEVQEDAASSPLAEVEERSNSADYRYEALPAPDVEDEHNLPLLQRQMFRTDI